MEMKTMVCEAELVRRLQSRDPAAFAELYDRYAALVYRVSLRLVRDAATAEDLTQETFVCIWNRIRTFETGRGTLAGWVALVARSRAIDYLRSAECRRSRRTGSLEDAGPCAEHAVAPTAAVSGERPAVLREPWRKLSGNQRQTLRLAFYADLSQAEIAARLNRPLGTVKTWMRSALRSLRSELEGAGAR